MKQKKKNKHNKHYYNDGNNEILLSNEEKVPDNFVKGRLHQSSGTNGYFFVNNGIEVKFLPPGSIIPKGFVKGRLKKFLKPAIDARHSQKYVWCNNGIDQILIKESDIPPDGFMKGGLPLTDEHKEKLSKAHIGMKMKPEVFEKIIETKRKKHKLNFSEKENIMYKKLVEQYGKNNILRHYKCDRYPYYCDFYIPSEDLFIELNAHWTHGGKPYDPTDESCQKQLEQWQEKAKTSQFYANAINTWTVRDVAKQKCAKENNLNYKTIY